MISVLPYLNSFAQTSDTSIVYKTVDRLKLKLYVFFPKNHKNADSDPCIIFFHGGSWIGGTPDQFFGQSKYLASRGMVAISVQYRIESLNGTSPIECIKDGKSAIRWVREHASNFGINPNMIAAGGGSAGGQVAAAAALLKAYDEKDENKTISSKPDALVLFNPVIDNGPNGYGYDRVKNYWQSFSPMNNIDSSAPPTLFMVGTRDQYIPTATAKKYQEIMESFGKRCDLVLYKNQKHGFFNTGKYYYKTLLQSDKFLTSLGYLKGEPKIRQDVKHQS